MFKATQMVKQAIEQQRMRCRVYTRDRVAAVAGSALISGGVGTLSLMGIAAHNLMTFDPDYEIGRDIISNKLYVEFKKSK